MQMDWNDPEWLFTVWAARSACDQRMTELVGVAGDDAQRAAVRDVLDHRVGAGQLHVDGAGEQTIGGALTGRHVGELHVESLARRQAFAQPIQSGST
jgi:hypothetical protein